MTIINMILKHLLYSLPIKIWKPQHTIILTEIQS